MAYKSTLVAKKILNLAAKKAEVLTPMQLIKLVYLSHCWMLGLYRKPLVEEAMEAWQYGPVVPELYSAIKHYRSNPVLQIDCEDEEVDDEALDIITQVYDKYGSLTGIELSILTHEKGSPWESARNSGSTTISNDLIAYHYKKLAAHG